MPEHLPFPVETIGWNDMTELERDFFCFQDEYLPLPDTHASQIRRIRPDDARRIWEWLGPSIPQGWPELKPDFTHRTEFELDSENFNSSDGVQIVRQWLHERGIPYSNDVFLVYEANRIIQMPWKIFVRYWDALSWSVGYSMIAMDHTRQWACCIHHENWIVFGTYT